MTIVPSTTAIIDLQSAAFDPGRDPGERVERVRQRQRVCGDAQCARHLVVRHEQPGQEDLRQEHCRHELDSLELAGRERAQKQAERHAEHRVCHCERDHQRRGAVNGHSARRSSARRGRQDSSRASEPPRLEGRSRRYAESVRLRIGA
jgi:hypothetical protein